MIITKYVLNCANPRLSDEEVDPLEQDEHEGLTSNQYEGWVPWDADDLIDIQNIINDRMPMLEQQIMDAFLSGMNYNELGVSEKYWRYHYRKAIEFIQKELKIWPV